MIETVTAVDRASSLRQAAHKLQLALLALEDLRHDMRHAGSARTPARS